MIDVHEYQVFSSGELEMSWDQHISTACSKRSQYANFHLWTVVGEWSLAFTDCAKYLNGRGIGARYDGSRPGSTRIGSCTPWTGSGNDFSDQYKAFLRKFWEAQVTGKHLLLITVKRGIHVYGQHGRRGAAGSTGRGRLRTRMNGVIKLVSTLDGFHRTPTSATTPTFAVRGIQNVRRAVAETYLYNMEIARTRDHTVIVLHLYMTFGGIFYEDKYDLYTCLSIPWFKNVFPDKPL